MRVMDSNLVGLDHYFAIGDKVEKARSAAHSHVNFTRLHIFHVETLDCKWEEHFAVFEVFNYHVFLAKIFTFFFDNLLACNFFEF